MNLSVKEAARLLTVSEKTIYRWIKQEIVPVYRVHESYRFNRTELIEWATSRRMGISPEAFTEPLTDEQTLPTLKDALEAGGVHYRIEGTTREEALADTVAHLRLPDEIDRDYLYKVLLAREKIASTGIGAGIAIPHPRNPVLLHASKPTLTLCFLEHPVNFFSLDGQLTRMLFTLIAPSLRQHLHLLSKLGFILHDADFRRTLEEQASRESIFSALNKAEMPFNLLQTAIPVD
jgi:PTS system nitrogen regulatory IIA component